MLRIVTIVVLMAASAGCASPCDEIAEQTCTRAGAESKECKDVKAMAARADSDMKGQCDKALALYETTLKQR